MQHWEKIPSSGLLDLIGWAKIPTFEHHAVADPRRANNWSIVKWHFRVMQPIRPLPPIYNKVVWSLDGTTPVGGIEIRVRHASARFNKLE